MFTQVKSYIVSNKLIIGISSGGFLFSLLIGITVANLSNPIIFSLVFLGLISFAYLIYKDINIGIGIFIGSILFEYSVIPILSVNASISKMIGILILGLCILKLIIERKNLILNDRKSTLIGLFFIWCSFSLLYVSNIELGIARIITLFQLILAYIILIKTINDSKALTKILLVVTIIGIVISVISMITVFSSPHILAQSSAAVQRYEGSGKDPNMFAQNFLALLPFCLFFYLTRSKTFILAIMAFIFVLLCTFSRGAFVGLIVTLLSSAIIILKRRKHSLVFLLATFPILVASIIFLNKNRAVERRLVTHGSTQVRIELAKVALDMGINNFITGVGIGNFIEHSDKYGNKVHYRRESHNGFLDVFATLGLPGFIIFLYIIYLCFKDFWLGMKHTNLSSNELKNLIQLVFISFISFLITGLFLGLTFVKMFWVLVAFSSICKKIAVNE